MISQRYTLFPIQAQDEWSFKMYKQAVGSFWTVEEIDLNGDKKDWDLLDTKTTFFLERILGFFVASDGIVNENISLNFSSEVQYAEARYFYTFQMASESVHSEMYSLLIDTYITDKTKKEKLFKSIINDPFIKKKAEWAIKWFNRDNSFAKRIVALSYINSMH